MRGKVPFHARPLLIVAALALLHVVARPQVRTSTGNEHLLLRARPITSDDVIFRLPALLLRLIGQSLPLYPPIACLTVNGDHVRHREAGNIAGDLHGR